ncbi:hypothetical protein RSAG8_08122, partial [Rhizoctonia solani AG-8 WAC10335]
MSPLLRKANPSKGSPWDSGWRAWRAWLKTLWPLAAHLILVTLITTFVVCYVDDNYFNLHDRLPLTSLINANGERIRWDRHAPLQSDITTIISASLVALRWVVIAWTVGLKWRSAFMLMGTNGLHHQSLKQIVGYGLLFPSPYVGGPLGLLVGATLLINMVAPSLSPLLTGSISWVPSNTPARHLTNITIKVPVAFHSNEWDQYQGRVEWRNRVTVQAAGLVTSAWQPGDGKGALKRALRNATGLNVNSTIANVTLPYFAVLSLEWISDPTRELSSYQRDVDGFWSHVGVGDGTALTVPGTVAMIPDRNSTWQAGPFPSPGIRSETRILVIYTSRMVGTLDPTCRLDNSNISSSLPPSLGLINQRSFCYGFARVTYEAGASVCTECRVSSALTIQNDTEMVLTEDTMTNEALWMLPDVANILVLSNTSILSSWGNLDDYVSELLARSYCGAWNGLHQWSGGRGEPLISEFSLTLPAIKAQVNLQRVYAWFVTQILASFFGICFLSKLGWSRDPLLGDTSMVPFYFDTSEVTVHQAKGLLEVNRVGDRWKITESSLTGD